MIDFTADIKSKHSVANILLGDNISSYIDELYKNHSIKIKKLYLARQRNESGLYSK